MCALQRVEEIYKAVGRAFNKYLARDRPNWSLAVWMSIRNHGRMVSSEKSDHNAKDRFQETIVFRSLSKVPEQHSLFNFLSCLSIRHGLLLWCQERFWPETRPVAGTRWSGLAASWSRFYLVWPFNAKRSLQKQFWLCQSVTSDRNIASTSDVRGMF